MMKRNLWLVTLTILLGVMFGCSANKGEFNDENITFDIVHSKLTNEYESYSIDISNSTGFDLTHLTFYLDYPIKTSNGSKGNPFVVEGKTSSNRPVNLKSGETVNFSIFAPIEEVFGESNLLDFEHPSIKLQGYINDGKEEIPFTISGGLSVLVK